MKRIFSLILVMMAVQMMWGQSTEIPEVDLTKKIFYVKEDGNGDGSSWDKAMGPQTFAYYLPQVIDGSTFHVAEGVYQPVYDTELNVPKDSSKLALLIRSGVTVKGGYPADATGEIESDPSRYKTIFKSESLFWNEDYCKTSYPIFVVNVDSKNVTFDGIYIERSCYVHGGINLVAPNSTIRFNKLYSTENDGTILSGTCENSQVIIENSYFFDNGDRAILLRGIKSLDIKNTSFKDNVGLPSYIVIDSMNL